MSVLKDPITESIYLGTTDGISKLENTGNDLIYKDCHLLKGHEIIKMTKPKDGKALVLAKDLHSY